jgi:hypothetical protein
MKEGLPLRLLDDQFQLLKGSQLFIGTRNASSLCINNPDRSPV